MLLSTLSGHGSTVTTVVVLFFRQFVYTNVKFENAIKIQRFPPSKRGARTNENFFIIKRRRAISRILHDTAVFRLFSSFSFLSYDRPTAKRFRNDGGISFIFSMLSRNVFFERLENFTRYLKKKKTSTIQSRHKF